MQMDEKSCTRENKRKVNLVKVREALTMKIREMWPKWLHEFRRNPPKCDKARKMQTMPLWTVFLVCIEKIFA